MDTLIYLIQCTLPVAVPLLLAALGGMFSERSGVVNIALEGIMLFGAFLGTLTVFFLQDGGISAQVLLLVGMVAAAVAGTVYSLLLAVAAVSLKANQTIAGTALNMLVPAVMLLVCKTLFDSDGIATDVYFFIPEVPVLAEIPVIGELFFTKTYATVYLGLVLLVLSTILLYKTRFGLRLRACGEHPQAAASVGINVYHMRYAGVVISGILGGTGGFFYAVGVMNGNSNGYTGVAGFGFLALAVMIFGQWQPVKILIASLMFAFFRTVAYSTSIIPILSSIPVDNSYYKMLPYIVTIIVLIFTSRTGRAPKARGVVYDKGKR
ncbi:MAG: ABC transporter permease [Lachnospiraceae bacterium]|nr:ABC transporter permease [Lachnospiraceae bacterium]